VGLGSAKIAGHVSRYCRRLYLLGREEVYADDVGRYVRTGELGRESLGSEVAILERMGHLFRERRKLESFVESMFVTKWFAEWLRCRLSMKCGV
jgi:hypothetical protein